MEDFAAQVFFALPLALTGIVEEISQRPVLPLQKLPVQQQGKRCLCCRSAAGEKKKVKHDYILIIKQQMLNIFLSLASEIMWSLRGIQGPCFKNRWRTTQRTVGGAAHKMLRERWLDFGTMVTGGWKSMFTFRSLVLSPCSRTEKTFLMVIPAFFREKREFMNESCQSPSVCAALLG